MTSVPLSDARELLEMENRKAWKNTEKAVTAVKIKIQDDFERRQIERDLTAKAEKVSRTAK